MAAGQGGDKGFFRFHEFLLAMMTIHHTNFIAIGQVPEVVILAVGVPAQMHSVLWHDISPVGLFFRAVCHQNSHLPWRLWSKSVTKRQWEVSGVSGNGRLRRVVAGENVTATTRVFVLVRGAVQGHFPVAEYRHIDQSTHQAYWQAHQQCGSLGVTDGGGDQ